LNDFNSAYVLPWNVMREKYCRIRSRHTSVSRSPEELSGGKQDETKDIYAYGNSIYKILTGLRIFYDELYREKPMLQIVRDIRAGERPYIDHRFRTRSFIESKLVELIESCWKHRGNHRPAMSDIVNILQRIKDKAKKLGELKTSDLIQIAL